MKNQDTTNKIQLLIETLKEIFVSSEEALNELQEIQRDLNQQNQQQGSTEARPRETTSTNKSD